MIHVRERRIHDLRRHEVGEDFLHPHVVEPAHRHQVAEPHVRGLVRDHRGAAEQLVLRRRFVEHQPRRVVEDLAGVLHAAELERGDRDEVELAERVRDRRVALEELERAGVQIEDRVAIARHLGRVGFAMEHAEGAAVAFRGLDLEVAGDERDEIGRQRLGLRERHYTVGRHPAPGCLTSAAPRQLGAIRRRLPFRRMLERQRPAALEVGLIEHRKRQPRPRRHEQRVEEIVAAIERRVAGIEGDANRVGARRQ